MSLEIVQIIEDEPFHAQLLDHSLRQAHYRTNVAGDGLTGLADVKRLSPAVILLDLMLPGLNGYEICRAVRSTSCIRQTPIIMISALGGEEHRVDGIELGADDYLVKPFSPREVVSRVGALLRRNRCTVGSDIATGDSSMSVVDRCLVVNHCGKQLTVSQRECQLLQLLASRPNCIVTAEELGILIWGDSELLCRRELEALMRRLKTQLENNFSGSIEIIGRVGYRYAPPPNHPE